jgi:hypothetical protein
MDPITRSAGETETERYLAKLCDNTFLSLWSYPNLYTREGMKNGKGVGNELCDLLVVFGADIIVFSDKDIRYNSEVDTQVAWNRWRKRSITESARQLYGAEKWIREHPNDIYLDRACTKPFPFEIERTELRVHLIAVTKNSAIPAQRFFGGGSSGSLMLIPRLTDDEVSRSPFTINDLDPQKTFVHVLDELTLNVLFGEIDTTYDLVRYLRAKEDLIRGGRLMSSPGEEELLAYYLLNGGLVTDNPLELPKTLNEEFETFSLGEGLWQEYLESDQRRLMRGANQVSYFWDSLIENFAGHIRAGTVAINADKPTSTHEQALRFLAAEGRLGRRFLSSLFLEKLADVPPDRRSSRVCPSPFNSSVCFILVLYPRDHGENYDHYRKERLELLHAYALVAQHKFSQYKWITLIATEPRTEAGRSEDVLAVEVGPLSEEETALAIQICSEEGVLNDIKNIHRSDSLAPGLRSQGRQRKSMKVGRNDPCPCSSGKKWKKCCG